MSKLIFCWKVISLDVDFVFNALRREGKKGTLIAFCFGTSLCDTWFANLGDTYFTGTLLVGPPQNTMVSCRNNVMCRFCFSECWRKGNTMLEGSCYLIGDEFFILVGIFTSL